MKLGRLPDRETVKITFVAGAELNAALKDYAELYQRTYGRKEAVSELIPHMLTAFMYADPSFKRARKDLGKTRADTPSHKPQEQ